MSGGRFSGGADGFDGPEVASLRGLWEVVRAAEGGIPRREEGEEQPPPGLSFMEEMLWIKEHKAQGGQVAPMMDGSPTSQGAPVLLPAGVRKKGECNEGIHNASV